MHLEWGQETTGTFTKDLQFGDDLNTVLRAEEFA